MNKRKMVVINEQSGIFSDAFIGNHNGILFGSFWGRHTSIQQFLARMELPDYEGGISKLSFRKENSDETINYFHLQNTSNLQKLSGKVTSTIYGNDLAQIFIYDKSTAEIDYSNHKATILYFDNKKLDNKIIWKLLKSISPIPLLDGNWINIVLELCSDQDYINTEKGYGGVSALTLNLDADEFENKISNLIKNKILMLN